MTRTTDPDIRLLAALADPIRLSIVRQLAACDGHLRLRLHRVLRRLPADGLAPPPRPPRGGRRDVGAARDRGSGTGSRRRRSGGSRASPATSSRATSSRPPTCSGPAAGRLPGTRDRSRSSRSARRASGRTAPGARASAARPRPEPAARPGRSSPALPCAARPPSPTSSDARSLKSGSWPTRTGRCGSPLSARIAASTSRSSGPASPSWRRTSRPSRRAEDLRRLGRAHLRRAHDRVGPRAQAAEQPGEPLGLLPSLPRQRPVGVRPGPGQRDRRHRRGGPGGAQACVGRRSSRVPADDASRTASTRSPMAVGGPPEGRQPGRLVALDRGRVVVAPVERLVDPGEDRADLAGVVADRDRRSRTAGRGTRSPTSSERHDASMPASARTRSVSGLTPRGSVPALRTSKRSPPWWRRSASAMTLRAELPVQTKRTPDRP